MLTGGCHCGAIRYEIEGEPLNHALCHCVDCRRSSGAPMTGWAMMRDDQLSISGEISTYASSEDARRHFCIQCGTGLFYSNEAMLPGMVDVKTGTLDEPDELPPECHIQTAERVGWMADAHHLVQFERFPPQEGDAD
ncbi:GFA family protein [Qipengyuania sp. DSG2-2]|uniref:GFA family protein n=1 Tax=Qipengyuania sp. DGS2-2 TaxID=3349631 RepID=UPI0036D2EA40